MSIIPNLNEVYDASVSINASTQIIQNINYTNNTNNNTNNNNNNNNTGNNENNDVVINIDQDNVSIGYHNDGNNTYAYFNINGDNRGIRIHADNIELNNDVVVNGSITNSTITAITNSLTSLQTSIENCIKWDDAYVAGSYTTNKFAKINTDGVMEVGKYIDFHDTNSSLDYDSRLYYNDNAVRIKCLTHDNIIAVYSNKVDFTVPITNTSTIVGTNVTADNETRLAALENWRSGGLFNKQLIYDNTIDNPVTKLCNDTDDYNIGIVENFPEKYWTGMMVRGGSYSRSFILAVHKHNNANNNTTDNISHARIYFSNQTGSYPGYNDAVLSYDELITSTNYSKLCTLFNKATTISYVGDNYDDVPLTVYNNADGKSSVANFLAPNITAENYVQLRIGKNTSSYNAAEIQFVYNADNAESNYLRLGLYGDDKIVRIYRSKMDINNGILNIYNSAVEDCLCLWAPDGGEKWINLGVNTEAGNVCSFGFKYIGNKSADNRAGVWLNGHIMQWYQDKVISLKNLTINTGNTSTLAIKTNGNDWAELVFAETTTNSGSFYIDTHDDGTEPIICRQFQSTSVKNAITLLDASGYSRFYRIYTPLIYGQYAQSNATSASVYSSYLSLENNEFRLFNGCSLYTSTYRLYWTGDYMYVDGDSVRTSDARLKENIKPLGISNRNAKINIKTRGTEDEIETIDENDENDEENDDEYNHVHEIIDKTKIYAFHRKNHNDSRREYGVLAQELQEVAPELVFDDAHIEGSDENYLGVAYEQFIPLLILKCQEQQKEINENKEIINNLQDRITKLESLIEKLIQK